MTNIDVEQQKIEEAMSLMGKRSIVAQRKKFGDKFGEEMSRRSKMRLKKPKSGDK